MINTNTNNNERFESFVSAVTRAYKCIQKVKNFETGRLGLKGHHVMCIYFLGKNPAGLTAAELCKLCNEDKAAVSRTVLDLTQKGLVAPLDLDTKRKYRTVIKLSRDGIELNEKINNAIDFAVMKSSTRFTQEERECFYRVFFNIVDNLEEYCKTEYTSD